MLWKFKSMHPICTQNFAYFDFFSTYRLAFLLTWRKHLIYLTVSWKKKKSLEQLKLCKIISTCVCVCAINLICQIFAVQCWEKSLQNNVSRKLIFFSNLISNEKIDKFRDRIRRKIEFKDLWERTFKKRV